MKQVKTSVFVCLLGHVMLLTGCYVGPVPTFDTGAVEGMQPVYEEDLIIQKTANRDLMNPGKILSYGPILLVTEKRQGIHVYDNSNPSDPVNLFFVEVLDNNDVTIRDGLIYLDNGPDLVSLKVTMDTLIEVSRVRSLMNSDQLDVSEFPGENDVYYECPDPERGPVVFWRTATLTDPKCYKRR